MESASDDFFPADLLIPRKKSLVPAAISHVWSTNVSIGTVHLESVPEIRMIIAQVIAIRAFETRISLAPVPTFVLPSHADEKHRRSNGTDPQEPQADTETCGILRAFTSDVDVARDDASAIAKTDHHGR